jgi:D-alanine transaminase
LLRFAYVNGRYLRSGEALVSIEDRGYQFADGVYEVCEVRAGAIIDQPRHLARLQRSLAELRIRFPVRPAALAIIMGEIVRRNRVRDGIVYVQITRGAARRDFGFPPSSIMPSLVVTARSLDRAGNERRAAQGIAVITLAENRWARVDIKSLSLLPNVLAKQAARERGADEAWFVDRDGRVTEGASSNAWIVTQDRKVVSRPADNGILRGITRTVLLGVIEAKNLIFEERPFSVEEAYQATEAFVTAASQIVMPVVRIDDRLIGAGLPGPVAKALRADFHRHAHWT